MKNLSIILISFSWLWQPFWNKEDDWMQRAGKWAYHASALIDSYSSYRGIQNGLIEQNPWVNHLIPPKNPALAKRMAVSLATSYAVSQGLDFLYLKFKLNKVIQPMLKGIPFGFAARHLFTAIGNYGR